MNAQHQFPGFLDSRFGKRYMDSHLVAIKVGVEGRADQRMNLDSAAVDQHRLKCLNAETVQGRSAV